MEVVGCCGLKLYRITNVLYQTVGDTSKIRQRIIVHGVIGLAAYTPNQLLICFSKMCGIGSGGRGGKGAGGDNFYSSMQTHTSIDHGGDDHHHPTATAAMGLHPHTKAYNNQQTY